MNARDGLWGYHPDHFGISPVGDSLGYTNMVKVYICLSGFLQKHFDFMAFRPASFWISRADLFCLFHFLALFKGFFQFRIINIVVSAPHTFFIPFLVWTGSCHFYLAHVLRVHMNCMSMHWGVHISPVTNKILWVGGHDNLEENMHVNNRLSITCSWTSGLFNWYNFKVIWYGRDPMVI